MSFPRDPEDIAYKVAKREEDGDEGEAITSANHGFLTGFSIVLPVENLRSPPDSYFRLRDAPTASPLPLFIYDSLLILENFYGVTFPCKAMTDIISNTIPGTLRGYRRHAVRGTDFPALVPNAADGDGGFVEGALVLGLSEEEKAAVDSFEGTMYDLVEVDVEVQFLAEGAMPGGWPLNTDIVRAQTYVWNHSDPKLEIVPIQEREWSIEPLVKGTWPGV